MSKILTATATMHTLSLTAMEEASRDGQRVATVEHLLLALSVNETDAGQVLRSLGITLERLRQVMAEQHHEELSVLGLETAPPAPGPIVFHETGGYEWDELSMQVFKRSSAKGENGDATAVLCALLDEPSGRVGALLARLDVQPASIADRLTEVSALERLTGVQRIDPSKLTATTERFIPAGLDDIWDLLVDAHRMPEWDVNIGTVTNVPTVVEVGSRWNVHATSNRPDGKPLKVKPAFVTQEVEVVECDAPHRIAWRFSYPDAEKANSRLVNIELSQAAAGAQLRVDFTWERDPQRPVIPLLTWVMRPLVRFSLWMQLQHISGGISRVFRS